MHLEIENRTPRHKPTLSQNKAIMFIMSLGTSNAWPLVGVLNIFTTLKKLLIEYQVKLSFYPTISFT